MIVSHRHRFIFLKTEKTGGTSLEVALARFCGPDDIVTGGTLDPANRMRKARNHRLGLGRHVDLPATIRHAFPSIAGYYAHMPARQVRGMIGEQVWRSYFKFAVERNPWDRQVSNYFHRREEAGDARADFERYLSLPHRLFHHVRLDNWGIYTLGGKIAVDAVIPYERLEEEATAICRKLGLGDDLALPSARSGFRPEGPGYRDYYTDRSRALVARWYRNEIDAFGYEF
jgi:hypothetical protein